MVFGFFGSSKPLSNRDFEKINSDFTIMTILRTARETYVRMNEQLKSYDSKSRNYKMFYDAMRKYTDFIAFLNSDSVTYENALTAALKLDKTYDRMRSILSLIDGVPLDPGITEDDRVPLRAMLGTDVGHIGLDTFGDDENALRYRRRELAQMRKDHLERPFKLKFPRKRRGTKVV